MKKTLSIHLGRQLFTIEEDAYDRLQQYLQRLEQSLNAETGVAEIMEDIEMRFAELIFSYLGENRKVVGITDVEKGIASLGEPEEISDEPSPQQQQKSDRSERSSQGKRLFRDSENGIAGGVASGIAAYFNIDPVVTRIAFVLLSFTGIGVPSYILLWIILPNALTPSDRLRMRGKEVTVDSLKEEFMKATEDIKDGTLRARDKFRNSTDHIAARAKHLTRTIVRIAGFGLVIAAVLWLVFFSLAVSGLIHLVPATGDADYLSLHHFLRVLIPVPGTAAMMWSAGLLVGFSNGLLAIIVGIRMMNEKYNRTFRIGILVLSVTLGLGLILGLISGLQTGRDFAVYSEVEQQHLTTDVPMLTVEELPQYSEDRKIIATGGVDFINIRNKFIYQDGILLTYRPSKDSLFHIYQVVSAHGTDRGAAISRSGRIRHVMQLSGSTLSVSPFYSFPCSDGLRNQEIEVIIEVPEGKNLKIKNINRSHPEMEYHGELRSNREFEVWNDEAF